MGSMIPCYDCFSEDGTIDYGDFSPNQYPCCNCGSRKYKRLDKEEKAIQLNEIAIHQVENHLLVELDKCNLARIKAIKENKIDSEIKMWSDMQVIYGLLVKHLETLK